jgi:hypothetical protein
VKPYRTAFSGKPEIRLFVDGPLRTVHKPMGGGVRKKRRKEVSPVSVIGSKKTVKVVPMVNPALFKIG